MKVTIYELIAMNKNELPKRIKIENDIFVYDNKENDYIYENGNISLFTDYIPDIYYLEDLKDALNQQVEIIEEEKKIPEKLKEIENGDFLELPSTHDIMNKINEIIDALEMLNDKIK